MAQEEISVEYSTLLHIQVGPSSPEKPRHCDKPASLCRQNIKLFAPQAITKYSILTLHSYYFGGTRCATKREVASSIPDGIIGIFQWLNPSSRTMVLGSTQPLTEMSTNNISWGDKGGRCVRLTTLPPSCTDYVWNLWEPEPPAALRACPGLYRDRYAFTITAIVLEIMPS
jgi:hypothetical protein